MFMQLFSKKIQNSIIMVHPTSQMDGRTDAKNRHARDGMHLAIFEFIRAFDKSMMPRKF